MRPTVSTAADRGTMYVVSVQVDNFPPCEYNTQVDTTFKDLDKARKYFEDEAERIIREEPGCVKVVLISWERRRLFPAPVCLHEEARIIDNKFTNTLYS